MKFIPLDAVLAEIERRIKRFREEKDSVSIVKTNTYKGILSFLNTLEVKEVDLEKEVDDWYNTKASKEFENVLYSDIENCAKHFFELGVNASNPLTWEDIKTIFLLVQVEWNPKKTDEEIYKEILKRFKKLR